jgi:predicted permease
VHAVLNAAVPIVALIFTGYVCGRCGVSPPAATDSLNRFAIYLALPALMFLAMSRATPGQAAQLGFVLAFAGGIAILFALGFALSRSRGRRVATARIEAWMRVTAMSASWDSAVPAVVLRVPCSAGLVASGNIAERASDRVGTVHGRQAVRTAARRHLGRDLRFARSVGVYRVGACSHFLMIN